MQASSKQTDLEIQGMPVSTQWDEKLGGQPLGDILPSCQLDECLAHPNPLYCTQSSSSRNLFCACVSSDGTQHFSHHGIADRSCTRSRGLP